MVTNSAQEEEVQHMRQPFEAARLQSQLQHWAAARRPRVLSMQVMDLSECGA